MWKGWVRARKRLCETESVSVQWGQYIHPERQNPRLLQGVGT